ncbi:PUA-like domain-containing protein [Elsinoe ampelina]|uniref:PUA-like domain-containing protein n=1 Tax=Elsinoe ampelina TaxID=302913 RepID=A0A6A6G1H6_9PEZI|nr:PUA-like domain-containing protein [Elsinoe ampelina]
MPPLYNDSDSEDEYLMRAARGLLTPSPPPQAAASTSQTLPRIGRSIPTGPRSMVAGRTIPTRPADRIADTVVSTSVSRDNEARRQSGASVNDSRRGSTDGIFVGKNSSSGTSTSASSSAARPSAGFAIRGAAKTTSAPGMSENVIPSKRKSEPSSPAIGTESSAGTASSTSYEGPFRIRKRSRTEDQPIKSESSSRRSSGAGLPTPAAAMTRLTSSSTADVRVTIPEWYTRLKKSNTRQKVTSGADTTLGRLKDLIKQSMDTNLPGRQNILDSLIQRIHDCFFTPVTGQLIRDHFLFHPAGLPSIIQAPRTISFPFYIRLDAENLFHKWANRDFGTDLLHGLNYSAKDNLSLKDNYALKRPGAVHGNNDLVNGQWWPFQMCLVRDGAHTSAMGGIGGRTGSGAFSVIMAGGLDSENRPYPDDDQGDTVLYCGTDGADGKLTANTSLLLENIDLGRPVRFMRSAKVHSKYAPEVGIRYDGLYRVVDFEVLDRGRQRYRFELKREAGQDPIRWEGEGKRPTRQEVEAVERLRREKKFVVSE